MRKGDSREGKHNNVQSNPSRPTSKRKVELEKGRKVRTGSGGGRRLRPERSRIQDSLINWKRQSLIFDPETFQGSDVTIVGLGNIGSQSALALARLGITNMFLYDHDTVEAHNLASQSFDTTHLGVPKVEATASIMKKVNPTVVAGAVQNKFDGKSVLSDILIIAVDSMKERKRICANMKKAGTLPRLIIDGRMGGPQIEVYSIESFEEWEDTFVDNPSLDPCGARYICYSSMVIGSFIANQVKRFLKGEKLKKDILFNIDTYQLL